MSEDVHSRNHVSAREFLAEVRFLEQRLRENPASPLCVRLASHYLKVGHASEAKSLCEQAIALFPDYPTAYFILGKCLLALDHYDEAKNAFQRVLSILPDCQPAQLILRELAPPASGEPDKQPPSVDVPGARRDGEEPAESPERKTEGGVPPPDLSAPRTELTDLETLAKNLQHVKRMAPDPNATSDVNLNLDGRSQDAVIVSKTMAEIYASQGAYDKAIHIYRILIEKRPESGEEYMKRIRELQENK